MSRIPVPLPEHRLAPAVLHDRFEEARRACDAALGAVTSLPAASRTFRNTVEAIEQALSDFNDAAWRLQILKDIHTDASVRAASAEVEEASGRYLVEVAARRELSQAVRAWREGPGATVVLDPDEARLLELMQREFKRSGHELDAPALTKLVSLRTRLAELGTQFQTHLNENRDQVIVSEAQLEGLPESFVARLPAAPGGGRIVSTRVTDYVPFMENARDADARRRLYVAYNARESARNLPLLAEAVRLRHEAAALLGYATHADYVTEDRMAKSARAVRDFLEPLRTRIRPRLEQDLAKLAELKRTEAGDAGAQIEPWDVAYYLDKLRKRDHSIDVEQVRQYFPMARALQGMFEVYEQLFDLVIRELPDADVWADGVRLYEIRDAASGALWARFYADLHPREGKYSHAAVAPLSVPREVDGTYRTPVSVIMGNFAPPAGDRPSLLTHAEVRTLFHEFGHVVHQSLTVARYGSQAGFSVAGDFVEAPSQMLENWIYEPEVLARISGHFERPEEALPGALVQRLRDARTFDAGWAYSRQLFFALFDQGLHAGAGPVDAVALEHVLYREVLALEPAPESRLGANFGHLMGGYDAGYYGYLWSEVFAADMFTLFETQGVMDVTLGRRYRDTILAQGRSVEADRLLEAFLGRPPSPEAFLRKLGAG